MFIQYAVHSVTIPRSAQGFENHTVDVRTTTIDRSALWRQEVEMCSRDAISSAHQKDSCMNLFTPSHYHESLKCLKLEHFLCGEKKTLGFGMGCGPAALPDSAPQSKLRQRFRAPSGYGATSSSDFERPPKRFMHESFYRVSLP